MPESSEHEQLINALIDGELDQARVQNVRKLLSTHPHLNRTYQTLVEQKEACASLPRFSLSANFSQQVLAAAKNAQSSQSLDDSGTNLPRSNDLDRTAIQKSVRYSPRVRFAVWQFAATALASSAATALLIVSLSGNLAHVSTPAIRSVSSVETSPGPVGRDDFTGSLLEDEIDLAGQIPGDTNIEQVWLLEAQDNRSGEKLALTLAANAIKVPGPWVNDGGEDQLLSSLDEEIDGILIEASSRQMKRALLELADSQEFEISAFTLPGHESYFADVRQNKTTAISTSDPLSDDHDAQQEPSKTVDPGDPVEHLVTDVVARAQQKLVAPALAQRLRERRFPTKANEKKKAVAEPIVDKIDIEADGPDASHTVAPSLGSNRPESREAKKDVEALFPNKQQEEDPKGSYLLLIRSASKK